jgi:hypothetical protein
MFIIKKHNLPKYRTSEPQPLRNSTLKHTRVPRVFKHFHPAHTLTTTSHTALFKRSRLWFFFNRFHSSISSNIGSKSNRFCSSSTTLLIARQSKYNRLALFNFCLSSAACMVSNLFKTHLC